MFWVFYMGFWSNGEGVPFLLHSFYRFPRYPQNDSLFVGVVCVGGGVGGYMVVVTLQSGYYGWRFSVPHILLLLRTVGTRDARLIAHLHCSLGGTTRISSVFTLSSRELVSTKYVGCFTFFESMFDVALLYLLVSFCVTFSLCVPHV